MGGWYKLRDIDAHHLTRVMHSFTDPRSHNKRMNMLLYCWSQMQRNGKPCPYFSTGVRTIARECGVTYKSARTFVDALLAKGFVVDLGEDSERKNRYHRRTFWWVADEAGIEVGAPQGAPQGAPKLGRTPATKPQRIGAHRCAQSPEALGAHQSTEYSEDASRSFAGAKALASSGDGMDEAGRWYVENGVTPPVPCMTGGGE